jgi:CHAD domain-containing protein
LARDSVLTPEIEVREVGDRATAGEVVRRALALSAIRLVRHDPVMRLGADPEGVHQARVATRRLRSDLRTFRSLVDKKWSTELRDELGWLAERLGDVRDGDVLLARLRESAAGLAPTARSDAAPVLQTLEDDRNVAHAALLETLRGHRYVDLLDRLVAAATAPALRTSANAPASEVVPALVRRPWHKLEKRARALGERPSDEKLHELRIATKRVRYAAEAATPVAGKPAREFGKTAERLQEALGELNDAVVARRWLEEWAQHERSPGDTRGAEALAEREADTADRLRGAWRPAWEVLETPRLRAWM